MHISPTCHLDDFVKGRTHHLLLAHLVEEDKQYAQWYVDNKKANPSHVYILDNSAFEMYKRGLPMYDPNKLIDQAHKVSADYLVLPDYPASWSIDTIKSAEKWAPLFKDAGFKTFYVPQSYIGDLDDYHHGLAWAKDNELVDYVGLSILAAPNAFGVEKNNKLQRFLSRWALFNDPEFGKLIKEISYSAKIHLLGMTDGPNELQLLAPQITTVIDSWDSSAAVWAGLNGISFDKTPTGLVTGKFEKEVDFNFRTTDNKLIKLAKDNVSYIDKLVDRIMVQQILFN